MVGEKFYTLHQSTEILLETMLSKNCLQGIAKQRLCIVHAQTNAPNREMVNPELLKWTNPRTIQLGCYEDRRPGHAIGLSPSVVNSHVT